MTIATLYGPMEESELEKREGHEEYPDASVDFVEYWKDGLMVHRSVNVTLKGRDLNSAMAHIG